MTTLNDAAVEADRIIATTIARDLSDYNAVTNGFNTAAELNSTRARMHFEDLDADTASDIAGSIVGALVSAGFRIVDAKANP